MTDKQMMTQDKSEVAHVEQAKPLFWTTPAVDIFENQDELVLLADLPGVTDSDLQIQVSRGVLTLEAEVKSEQNDRNQGYYRQFRLSDRIDADAGNAALKDGVLTLRLPKSEAAKPKKIAVKMLH
jgi:HSP20 family molecular chaperone IbpA